MPGCHVTCTVKMAVKSTVENHSEQYATVENHSNYFTTVRKLQ